MRSAGMRHCFSSKSISLHLASMSSVVRTNVKPMSLTASLVSASELLASKARNKAGNSLSSTRA